MKHLVWTLLFGALLIPACATEPKVIQHLPQPTAKADAADRSRLRINPSASRRRQSRHVAAQPGWVPPGRISSRWECIVLHHSAGDVGGVARLDKLHRGPQFNWDELGYHFVIGNGSDTPNGAIEVGSRWAKQKHGAHCKTPDNYYNDQGIGICLVGNFVHHRPSNAQMRSLARLVRFLQANCHIPATKIYTHGQITGRTACPGAYFSVAHLHALLDGPTYLTSH